MFEVKTYTADDYETVSLWWKQWEWAGIPEAFLPENGLIVTAEGTPVCAAFIYRTDTPIYWVENYISDKTADKIIRSDALDLLVLASIEKAKDMGALVVMSSIKHTGLGRRLEKSGFVVSDKNMTVYMRTV
jgi:hypothetical protein